MTQTSDLMLERIIAGDFVNPLDEVMVAHRRKIVLTCADDIEMKPVHWLWEKRIAEGELALLAGPPGVGKSTISGAEWVAWITTGTMKGRYFGQPKGVIIAATEDSWEHTIKPRLVGAGADLRRVYRCEVFTREEVHASLSLPLDIPALSIQIKAYDVKLVILDPLMSRVSGSLDTHKDQEVRQALEPLTAMAKESECAFLGLIHTNKSNNTDPLKAIMASAAFGAVARTVLFAIKDPMDENVSNLGIVKSNLGSIWDVPTYRYRIENKRVGGTDEDPINTGVVVWMGDSDQTIGESLETRTAEGGAPAVEEAAAWLSDFLTMNGGTSPSQEIKKEGSKVGISLSTMDRARKRLKLKTISEGMPRKTTWQIPGYVQRFNLKSLDTTEPF